MFYPWHATNLARAKGECFLLELNHWGPEESSQSECKTQAAQQRADSRLRGRVNPQLAWTPRPRAKKPEQASTCSGPLNSTWIV